MSAIMSAESPNKKPTWREGKDEPSLRDCPLCGGDEWDVYVVRRAVKGTATVLQCRLPAGVPPAQPGRCVQRHYRAGPRAQARQIGGVGDPFM